MKSPLFAMGEVMATPGALEALRESKQGTAVFLRRHAVGDWGEVCEADRQANTGALRDGARLLSAYATTHGQRLWVITEADRSVTTLLLPEDY